MSEVTETGSFAVSADKLWALVKDFGGLDKIMPAIESIETEGEGVGMLRKMPMSGGLVVERLDVCDDDTRTLTYSITEGPLPFSDYSATMVVSEDAPDACTLTWTGQIEAAGVPQEKAERLASGIYKGGIAGYRSALGLD